ncbi:hypothetical protein [Paludisphaera mucosa]|uniref:Uncharacterized protein n=1 Tax=Paludisphaera mucosa TaxID=3030827 RepID=A0ABT6FK72_9BACT|nr:hypothetical protein [Paludisphaera mucosa]MDG3007971.1 hypothetical protein [Paludisphaera mucosa]
MAEESKSVGWVAAMLALLVAYFGWGFLAADYFQHDPTGDAEKANFWINSVTQLPNLPGVLSYGFRERLWIVGLVVGLEVGVLILWLVLRKLEKELSR